LPRKASVLSFKKQKGDGFMARKILSRIMTDVVTMDENKTTMEAAVLMTEKFKVKLKDIMSKDFVKVLPTDTCKHCLDLMKEHRCRHLLVYDDGEFLGIVSLRDLVALMIDEKEALINQLEDYIRGY
jgi:CBS domain-containing protein